MDEVIFMLVLLALSYAFLMYMGYRNFLATLFMFSLIIVILYAFDAVSEYWLGVSLLCTGVGITTILVRRDVPI